MRAGQIEQFDTPDRVFHQPKTRFVMNFLGSVNQFRGRLEQGKIQFGKYEYEVDGHNFVDIDQGDASVFVRPHDLELSRESKGESISAAATVLRVHSAGARVRVDLAIETEDGANDGAKDGPDETPDENLAAEITHQELAELRLEPGDAVFVTLRNIRVFSDTDGIPVP